MKYQTYVFDLDGTLLDTLDDLTAAVNAGLEKYGKKVRTRAEIRSFIGDGLAKLIERSLESEEKDEVFYGVYNTFTQFYAEHIRVKTKPYDGIENLLKALNEAGKTCAVLSNKRDGATKSLIKHFFPDSIKIAVGENEEKGIKRKPCPDGLLKVMEELGADKQSTVYIGDSEVDIKTAKNAGIPCISVTWGFKDVDFLKAQGATKIVTCPAEILEI